MAGSRRASDDQQHLVGLPSNSKLLPTPVTVTGISFVSTVWLVATFLIISALVIAAGFPQWLHNREQQFGSPVTRTDIGLYYLCYNLTGDPPTRDCAPYLQFSPPVNRSTGLNEADLQDIAFLFSASIVYAFGVGVQIISLVIGVVAYCKPRIKTHSVFALAFVFQVVAGISMVVALVLFPVSFESDFLRQFCGERADYYYRGLCSLDWSLFVAMVATACSLYLPALAIFSMNVSDGLRAHICC